MPSMAATVTPSSANASVVAKEESSSESDKTEGVSIPSPMWLISCQGSEVLMPVSAKNRQTKDTNSKLSDSF
mgnify:CR=1 FL=1